MSGFTANDFGYEAKVFDIQLDKQSIIKEIINDSLAMKKDIQPWVERTIFDPAVKKMGEEFMAHPVTQEVLGGVGAENLSETLEGFRFDGGKNLFSFIGFGDDQEETINSVREILGNGKATHGARLKYNGKTPDKGMLYFDIIGPNEQAIYNLTPLPFAPGLSWMRRVESDIPGVSRFLNVDGVDHIIKNGKSRSGGGIQVKSQLGQRSFKGTPYISQIIENFMSRVDRAHYIY